MTTQPAIPDSPRIRRLTFVSILGLSLVLALTGWGIITSGTFSMTVFLVPVTLGIVIFGLWPGLLFAAIFGLCSMYMAASLPPESPERIFMSPLVSLPPRLLAAFAAWGLAALLKRSIDDGSRSAKLIITTHTAVTLVLLHSTLVMLDLAILHPEIFGFDDEIDTLLEQSVVFSDLVSYNVLNEALFTLVVSLIVTFLYFYKRRPDRSQYPMNRSLRKWLTLALGSMALFIFAGTFVLNTMFEIHNAENTIDMVLSDIEGDYDELRLRISDRELLYKIGQNGHTVLVRDGTLVAADMTLPETVVYRDFGFDPITDEDSFFANLHGKKWLCRARQLDNGMTLIGMLPKYEIHVTRNRTVLEQIIGLTAIIVLVYSILNVIIRRNVSVNVRAVRRGLSRIRAGELDTRLDVRTNLEFSQITDDVNATVQSLQDARAEVERRMKADMELAHTIQMAMLPPGLLEHPKLQIAASATPAREVGGDFYDYFLLPNMRLGLVIADVSGKGVPAAMFMMTAKTIIRGLSESSRSPAEVFEAANKKLCENNDADMFVTAWLAFADLTDGTVTFTNAGHNPPIWMHGESSEYLDHKRYKRGLMLGARPASKYKDNVIHMSSKDRLILYTDGITEACNPELELFGEKRLLDSLPISSDNTASVILETILQAVQQFENGAEQADDKTIMVLKLMMNVQSIKLAASTDNTSEMLKFVENTLTQANIQKKIINKFLISTDEVFSNIAQYSKATEVESTCHITDGMITLSFRDNGTPYNPLDHDDPDLSLSLEERPIGGCGIYIVKKMMDKVNYTHNDGFNCLELVYNLTPQAT